VYLLASLLASHAMATIIDVEKKRPLSDEERDLCRKRRQIALERKFGSAGSSSSWQAESQSSGCLDVTLVAFDTTSIAPQATPTGVLPNAENVIAVCDSQTRDVTTDSVQDLRNLEEARPTSTLNLAGNSASMYPTVLKAWTSYEDEQAGWYPTGMQQTEHFEMDDDNYENHAGWYPTFMEHIDAQTNPSSSSTDTQTVLHYHESSRLAQGEALLVDPGAADNLTGDQWTHRQSALAVAAGMPATSWEPMREITIEGLGHTPDVARFRTTTSIAIPPGGIGGTYEAATVNNSMVPALLGLRSLTEKRAVLDMVNDRLILAGPGGFEMRLSLGSRVLKLTRAKSGHLMLPVSAWASLTADNTRHRAALKRNSSGVISAEPQLHFPATSTNDAAPPQ
jgi:hypothetical protein